MARTSSGEAKKQPSWCFIGIVMASPAATPGSHADSRSTRRCTSWQRNRSVGVGPKRARQQVGLGQHLEPVADAQHPAAVGGVAARRPTSPARARRSRPGAGSRRRRTRRGSCTASTPLRSSSACQSTTGSAPISSTARAASRSSQAPGNVTMPTRSLTRRPRRGSRSRTARSAGLRAPGRRSPRPGGGPRRGRPCRARGRTPCRHAPPQAGYPSPASDRRSVSPCGSRMPSRGRTVTVTFTASPPCP